MERRIYEAAVEGNIKSLLNLLQEDALALDRFMVSCYPETPLHIASMLGHVDFVQEILRRKPELAGKLDSRKASPLLLATAKGYLDIVLKLVLVDPEMCYVCDRDGKNPLHIASIMGHVDILKELIQVRPQAARIFIPERGETILHACVNYNRLEAMKLLVETMNDHDFVCSTDENGNNILHLAVIDKQVEAIKFLTANTTIEVNALNGNGLTALDILTQSKRDVKDWDIGESLRCAGAIRAKSTHHDQRSTAQTTSTSVLNSDKNRHAKNGDEKNKEWLKEMRSTLMVVATVIASVTFQAGLSPPGGTWQETSEGAPSQGPSPGKNGGHRAGYSILADIDSFDFQVFYLFNTIGFVAALSIILLLVSGLPFFKRSFFVWILMFTMWIAISSMTVAYAFSVVVLESYNITSAGDYAVYVWICLMGIFLECHIVRLTWRIIKFLTKQVKKIGRGPTGSNGHEPAHHTV